MALNCVAKVRAAAVKLADPASMRDAFANSEDMRAAAAARVAASLALVAIAQDIRRAVDLLTDSPAGKG